MLKLLKCEVVPSDSVKEGKCLFLSPHEILEIGKHRSGFSNFILMRFEIFQVAMDVHALIDV
jgi:hypothetical protein